MSDEKLLNQSSVCIKNRSEVSISGVKAILELNDEFTSLDTEQGRLIIEGSEIKLQSFQKEEKTVYIIGKIETLYYQKQKISTSVFSKLRR